MNPRLISWRKKMGRSGKNKFVMTNLSPTSLVERLIQVLAWISLSCTAWFIDSNIHELLWFAGADPGFWYRGVQKIMCRHTHYEREALSPLRPGSRVRLRALEAIRVFYAISCATWALFVRQSEKNGIKNTQSIQFGGGGGRLLHPL